MHFEDVIFTELQDDTKDFNNYQDGHEEQVLKIEIYFSIQVN